MSPAIGHMLYQVLFYATAAAALIFAACVVLSRNPVRSILFLVLTFFASAAIWIMLQAEFLGLILVVVYVGAVMTLFLFVIMMLDLQTLMKHRGFIRAWPVAVVLAALILAALIAFVGPWHFGLRQFAPPAAVDADYGNTKVLGVLLYTHYVLAFELAGVLLLAGMIAAIALTKPRRGRRLHQRSADQLTVKAADRLRLVKDIKQTEQQ